MFKACMKNYFSNLKYVFVALGVMFIMLIFATQGLVNQSVKEINTMVSSIQETTQSSDLSLKRIGDSIKDTTKAIKTNINPAVLTGQEEPTLVKESIGDALEGVIENYIAYFSEIVIYIATAITGIIVAVIIFIGVLILGLFLSDGVITIFGRYDISHDNIFKIILEQLVRGLFIILLIALIVAGYTINLYVGLVLTALYPLGYCFIALLSAWTTAGESKRPKFTEYVTFVNVLALLGANLVQLIISVAIAAIIYLLGGPIIAVVFGLALIVLASANANLNAYVFLYKLPEITKEKEEKKVKTFVAEVEAAAEEKVQEAAIEEVVLEEVEKVDPILADNLAEEEGNKE